MMNTHIQKKRFGGGFVSCIVALFILVSIPAYGITSESLSLTQEYHYTTTTGAPTIPTEIVDNGNTYHLKAQEGPVEVSHTPPVQTFWRTEEKTITVSQYAQGVRQQFLAFYPINEGGFKGEIYLEGTEATAIYYPYERAVNKTRVYTARSTEDIGDLPLEEEFTVTSASALDGTENKVLKRAELHVEPSALNAVGIPIEWQATAIFRGVESYLSLDHYDVIAHYSGDITLDERMYKIVATYEAIATDDPEEDEPVTSTQPKTPLAATATPVGADEIEQSRLLWPYIATGVVIVLSGALLFWLLRRKVSIVEVFGDGSYKIVKRVLLKRAQEAFEVTIPTSLDIEVTDAKYALLFPKRLVDAKAPVSVYWRGETIYAGPVRQTVVLRADSSGV
jgi:hypothetical protein